MRHGWQLFGLLVAATAVSAFCLPTMADEPVPIRVLLLGDNGHHRPADLYRQLEPVLKRRGILLTYTDQIDSLLADNLAKYDGLAIYANITRLPEIQERALLDYVENGHGLIALHCASYCFHNSPRYIALVGAQFARHATGRFRTIIAEPEHPVMKGFGGFVSWDETYVHAQHNEADRTVLEYRAEGTAREPWTWVRQQGKGRVFYTAWGHDFRTWGNAGFQNLLERGIRWATNRSGSAPPYQADLPIPAVSATVRREGVKPFEYVDIGKKIPNYTPGAKWGVQGEPRTQMQKPLEPDESIKHLVVPSGFHVELFVAEPQLAGKPIAMNWDDRGRLWVAETQDYPNELQPRGKGRDRIRICEDTDGDGRADRFTVFAEQLSIPTSLTFARGGVIVFDGVQTVFLKDADGDDVADERTVLFEGWSQGDTHGGPSNMQYGLENWIWAMQGYNLSRLQVGGDVQEFRQGFLRFKPDGSRLEFVRSTDNNTWGFGMSEEGVIFGSTANHNPSVYMPIANRYYEAVRGWTTSLVLPTIADTYLFKSITDKVRQVDQFGGYTAAAGHALYTARRYPREYWNRTAFVCEPTGHLVGGFVIGPEGADFHSSNTFNLLASDDEWTAPIMAEVGPDGNVWVIDWYNYIVQHNPTPVGFKTGKGGAYETDLRDKKHGRIYRIVYDKPGASETEPSLSLANASPDKLVATLANSNLFWRRHAQRLLVERGQQDVVPSLIKMVSDPHCDDLGLNVGAIHALWTLQGLHSIDGSQPEVIAAAFGALKHPAAGVRRNAVQVLPNDVESVRAILAAGMLSDSDAQARLCALLALADRPAEMSVGAAIVDVLAEPANAADRYLPDAAICAGAKNSDSFLSALAAFHAPGEKLIAAATIVAEHRARSGPHRSMDSLIAALRDADPLVLDAIVQGLSKGWPKDQRPEVSEQLELNLEKLAAQLPLARRGMLVQLASSWGSERLAKYALEISRSLEEQIKNDSLDVPQRIAAATELVAYRAHDADTIAGLLALVTPRTPVELSMGLLQAMQAAQADDTARLLADKLPTFTPTVRSTAITVLLSRPEWTAVLIEELERGAAQLADLSLDQRQSLARHPNAEVRGKAQRLLRSRGAMPNADRKRVMDELVAVARAKGDPQAGKEVYKKQCAKCHVHGSEGQRIGPDLTGMAVHPKEEILGNIIDPSRSVESNFRVYTVITNAGLVLTGLLASESKTSIELFDAEAKRHTLLREDIDELAASTKSLMPEGFEKQVTRQEFSDLLEFLTQRGKFVPLPLNEAATVVSTQGMFYDTAAEIERLVFPDWSAKTFAGVPFVLIDPMQDQTRNAVLLYGPQGAVSSKMPKSVSIPCRSPAKLVHFLGGVSGWGSPLGTTGSVSMIVRLVYDDGAIEDHELKNGEQMADYIHRVDVPGSTFAFDLAGRQLRYLSVTPKRPQTIERIELVKGPDQTAPVVMAITVEAP